MAEMMSTLRDIESPLVRYELTFPNRTPLLGAGSGNSRQDGIQIGIPERLMDEIRWEPHIDEADKLDYIVAVSSGVISGLIDIFYVGEFSLDRAAKWGKDKLEKVVLNVARIEGYEGDDVIGAIKTLEKNHPFAADGNTNDFGGGLQHHFRDFAHHFSIGGLLFSILSQFTGMAVGADLAGNLLIVPIPEMHKQFIGKNFQEKIAFGTIGWFFHMVSDMAGSSGSLMGGTGIPGPLVSFMKELSTLPFFKSADDEGMSFRLWLSKLFNGTLLADRDENGKIIKDSVRKFDLRMEIGILGEIGRQTIPVLINQCVTRAFYFCRRTFREISELDIHDVRDLKRIAPEDVLPWGTPAMRRMITVSTGVFTGVDIADAAVRAIKSKSPSTFFLHVNYVGVATFIIACVVDVRASLRDDALDNDNSAEKAYEHRLSKLDCLKLDFMQARILHSIEHAMVAHDIAHEKNPKLKARKKTWLIEWRKRISETVSLAWAVDAGYFLADDMIYSSIDSQISSRNDSAWLWLVALEAVRFKPYAPLHGENDDQYKGLKICSDYLNETFCNRQDVLKAKDIQRLNKAVDSIRNNLDGSTTKRIAGVAGTLAVVVATSGVAFYFAPAIAPTLAAALGAQTAALSGAALTSASLAFLGGGALAAGGAGMAGGAMLIAGGGAIIGAVGGSGISAATTMMLATNGSYVLDECAKLVAYCDEVLIKRYGNAEAVDSIHRALNQRIIEFEAEIEAIKRSEPESEKAGSTNDTKCENEELDTKKMIKILNRSLKFLKRSNDRIEVTLKRTNRYQERAPR